MLSENKTEVKVGIMPAEDGSIKDKVVISESNSPPLLGAKAASGAKNAPAEDVTVAESGAEAPLDESILKKDLAAEEATAAETVDSDRVAGIYIFQQQHTTSELLGIEDSDVVDPSTLTTEVLSAPPVPLGGPAAGVLLPGQVGSQATRSATWPLVVTTIDARHMGGDRYLMDKEIAGREEDVTAHFFKDVRVAAELYDGPFDPTGGIKIYEGTDVDAQTFARFVEAEAAKRGAEHCILYIHGYSTTIGGALETVDAMNEYLDGRTPGAFVVPIIWPAEESFIDDDNLAVTYPQQKADAPGAARALRILLKKLGDANITLPISVMAHSMGNYLLGQFAPDADETPTFVFENIFMVAADIRASTFDASEPEARGAGIVRIAKNKIHILHNREDKALVGREYLNSGRSALGLVGLSTTDESQLIGKDMLVVKDCSEWTSLLAGDFLSHSYQATEEAMDYYLESLAGPGARKRKLRDMFDHAKWFASRYLAPFGLDDGQTYIAKDAADVERIKKANPLLAHAKFQTPSPDKQHITYMSGAMLVSPWNWDRYETWSGYESFDSMAYLSMAADYTGVAAVPDNQPTRFTSAVSGDIELRQGGGLVETFAFGGAAPQNPDDQAGHGETMAVTVGMPPTPFAISDLLMVSSFAPGSQSLFEDLAEYTRLYWPVGEPQKAEWWKLGDGGNMENIGLMQLIQRGATKGVAFMYTGYALAEQGARNFCVSEPDSNPLRVDESGIDLEAFGVDQSIGGYFGYGQIEGSKFQYDRNQVFPKADYGLLLCAFQRKMSSGNATVVQMTHTLVTNTFWGVEGGGEVEVLWYLHSKMTSFTEKLPLAVQGELENTSYPHYATEPRMTAFKVNLLMHHTEYAIMQNRDLFAEFLA